MFDTHERKMHLFRRRYRVHAEVAFPETLAVPFVGGFDQAHVIEFFLNGVVIKTTHKSVWLAICYLGIQL